VAIGTEGGSEAAAVVSLGGVLGSALKIGLSLWARDRGSDWRLFCTLIPFDVVYYIHFKCSLRRILDYPGLQGYLLDLYQQPGIAGTVSFDQIKDHYYKTHDAINPTRIVPIGPVLDLTHPHGREKIGTV